MCGRFMAVGFIFGGRPSRPCFDIYGVCNTTVVPLVHPASSSRATRGTLDRREPGVGGKLCPEATCCREPDWYGQRVVTLLAFARYCYFLTFPGLCLPGTSAAFPSNPVQCFLEHGSRSQGPVLALLPRVYTRKVPPVSSSRLPAPW